MLVLLSSYSLLWIKHSFLLLEGQKATLFFLSKLRIQNQTSQYFLNAKISMFKLGIYSAKIFSIQRNRIIPPMHKASSRCPLLIINARPELHYTATVPSSSYLRILLKYFIRNIEQYRCCQYFRMRILYTIFITLRNSYQIFIGLKLTKSLIYMLH